MQKDKINLEHDVKDNNSHKENVDNSTEKDFSRRSDEVSSKELEILKEKIDSLQYQNEVNVQHLHKMVKVKEQLRKDAIEKDKKSRGLKRRMKNFSKK